MGFTLSDILKLITGGNKPVQQQPQPAQSGSMPSLGSMGANFGFALNNASTPNPMNNPKPAGSNPGVVLGADIDNSKKDNPGGGGNGGNSNNGGNNGNAGGNSYFEELIKQQRELARAAYEEGKRRAGVAFDRARGIYDEGMGMLGKRRQQFQDVYNQGNEDIMQSYEGERGNMQASAQNNATKALNSLRAMGMGGSAMVRANGAQTQQNMKALGELNTEKMANERTNLTQYDENQDWAKTQESSLGRMLADAQEARTAAENQSGLIQSGDYGQINSNINSFLNKILENQMAIDAVKNGVSGKTVNPYAVNISDLASTLTAQLPGGNSTAQADNSGVSIDPNQTTLASNLNLANKKRQNPLYRGIYLG